MNTRQAIVNKVVDILQSIRTTNGYATDIGHQVHEWRDIETPPNIMPCVLVQDTSEPIADQGTTLQHTLDIEVSVLQVGATAAEYVRSAGNDIVRAFGLNYKLSGLVSKIVPVSRDISVKHGDQRTAGCFITLRATYSEYYPPEADEAKLVPFLKFTGNWDLAPMDEHIDAVDNINLEGA